MSQGIYMHKNTYTIYASGDAMAIPLSNNFKNTNFNHITIKI